MNENIVLTLTRNEAEAFFAVKKLDCTLHNTVLSLRANKVVDP